MVDPTNTCVPAALPNMLHFLFHNHLFLKPPLCLQGGSSWYGTLGKLIATIIATINTQNDKQS